MLKQINMLAVLAILLFSIGCTEKTPVSFSDCDSIKSEQKKDNCLARLVEISALNDTSKNIETCSMITDAELRSLCLFKISQDSWRSTPWDKLRSLCSNISTEPLRNSCNDIINRPHLQAIR